MASERMVAAMDATVTDLADGHDQNVPFTDDFYELVDPDGDRFGEGR